ncbi:MAG: RnfABCDGE type electron transport complex subunit D [Oscillospiraceae bacterium]|jgi:electron transport complex protein RnfD|nr:RnfABCDGE type electron transport complex subunit D [Oscillospiraceae bacterium]
MSRMIVSVSPHIRDKTTTAVIMRDVLIALFPALIAAILVFGWRSLLVTAVCVVSCMTGEWAFEKLTGRPNTVGDLSAAVTGVLLAYSLPAGIPVWQAVLGSLVAIAVVKQLFGGIGRNFANPAVTARIVMLLAFSETMTAWVIPDAVSGATPLAVLKGGDLQNLPGLLQMLLGVRGGCLGETGALALLAGGAYLLIRRVISWHTPAAFAGTVLLLTFLLGKQPVYQLMSGGLLLGAFFMATDYSTTPMTNSGRLIFGVGCGLITVLIRVWGNYPEGVSFSILMMNILTPYIARFTRQRPLGGAKL